MSTALLSQRLKELEHSGVLLRHPVEHGAGHEYELTEAGRALFPVLERMGQWAQEYSRDNLTAYDNLDPDLLMWNIRRRAIATSVPLDHLLSVAFQFSGVPTNRSRFWLVFRDGDIDLCLRDPGYDVSLVISVHIKAMTQVWLGHKSLDQTIRNNDLKLEGDRQQVEAFRDWFRISLLAAKDQ